MNVLINGQGLMTILIGGSTIICDSDLDCPGEATCAINQPWSAFPKQCVCPIDFSRTGANCHDVSPIGYGMFGLIIVTLVLASITFGFGCYDAYLMKTARIKFEFTAVQSSLIFLTVGSGMMIAAQLSLIGETFADFVLTTRSDRTRKSASFFVFTNICVAGTIFFGQLGMLNVCLVWLEVTDIRRRFQGNIQRFRHPVVFIAMIYFVVYAVLVGLDLVAIIAYASLPGFALIILGYVLGYFRLLRASRRKNRAPNAVVRTSAAENPSFESDVGVMGLLGFEPGLKPKSSNRLLKEKRREENLKKKLRNIAWITVSLVFFATVCISLLLATAGLARTADTPLVNITGYLYRACFICFASCLLTVAIFVHEQVCVLVGKKSRFITSNSSHSLRYSSRKSMAKRKKSAGQLVKQYDNNTGMSEILKRENLELRTRFTEFVRSKYADEPLVFYDACTKYQEAAQNVNAKLKGKNVLLITLGHQIIDRFVKEDSVKWVNISDDLRKELLKAASDDDFNEHTFDKAKVMAFELLKQNFYNQFVKMLEEEDEEEEADVVDIANLKDLNV